MPHVVTNICMPAAVGVRPEPGLPKATEPMPVNPDLCVQGLGPLAYASDESLLSSPVDHMTPLAKIPSTLPVEGLGVQRARPADSRRNLYVLSLPPDLAQEEFTRVFSAYGSVEHAVIMATLDQFNRRRGFIVMSTNTEASAAMRGLSGTQLRGHQLHVSFAVVQRSEGFLDGGDRTPRRRRGTAVNFRKPAISMGLASFVERPLSMPIIPIPVPSAPQSFHHGHSHSLDEPMPMFHVTPAPALSVSATSTSTTVIALNLCPAVLPTAADVHALFAAFGPVRAVRLARGSPGTAVVAFDADAPQCAAAAMGALDGILVGSCVLRVISAQL